MTTVPPTDAVLTDEDDVAGVVSRLREFVPAEKRIQREICERAGVNKTFLFDLFSGRSLNPGIRNLRAVCKAIPAPWDYIVTGLHLPPAKKELLERLTDEDAEKLLPFVEGRHGITGGREGG